MAAGPATAAFLAGLGADVLKVEPPSGDGTRWVHPRQNGMGTNFLAMNAGKRDAILDLKSEQGREKALQLAAGADVLLQNLAVGVVERLGLGYDTVNERNPGLVYCSISGYGRTGPLAQERGHDLAIQASSGFARLNGRAGGGLEHFRFSGFIDLITAATAANAIIAGLVERGRSGLGQEISVSMLEAALEVQFTRFNAYITGMDAPDPDGTRGQLLAPDRAYRALDRWVFLTVASDAQWRRFCDVIDRPQLAADPRFSTNAARMTNVSALDAEIEERLAQRPAIVWLRHLRRAGIAAATERSIHEIAFDRQVSENEMAVELNSAVGSIMLGGLPWHFSRTPGAVRTPPVPGADTESVSAIAQEWKRRRDAEGSPGAAVSDDEPILAGRRVLELADSVAGRLAALRLQDLGAEVIRCRLGGATPDDGDAEPSPALVNLNALLSRGKQTVVIDRARNGAEDLQALIGSADVVISDRSELDPLLATDRDASRRGDNDRVWVELSAFGPRGPLAGANGSELTAQAVAGYTEWLGKHGAEPVRLGADVASCATAIFATGAALAGLLVLDRGGSGQTVELSLLNSLLSLATIHIAGQFDPDDFDGPRVLGPFYAPQAGWRTAGRPIAFSFGGAVGEDGRAGWLDFIASIGAEWLLEDPRFAGDPTGRSTTGIGPLAEDCRPAYEQAFARLDDQTLIAAIRRCGGVAAPYVSYEDLLEEQQLQALGVICAAPEGSGRVSRATGFPAHFSRSKPALRWSWSGPETATSEKVKERT